MQAVKAAVDYSYDSLNAFIKCLLLFFSTIIMTKKSTSDFTKDDADDIINRRNGRGPDRGGFGGNQGTSSTLHNKLREASDVHGWMRRRRLIRFRKGEETFAEYDVAPENLWTGVTDKVGEASLEMLCVVYVREISGDAVNIIGSKHHPSFRNTT